MSENGTVTASDENNSTEAADTTTKETIETTENTVNPEDVSYHAVEKDGNVTAIWEMNGRKHIRTINPRSSEGKQILALFETAA